MAAANIKYGFSLRHSPFRCQPPALAITGNSLSPEQSLMYAIMFHGSKCSFFFDVLFLPRTSSTALLSETSSISTIGSIAVASSSEELDSRNF